jgi:hypothetical protein
MSEELKKGLSELKAGRQIRNGKVINIREGPTNATPDETPVDDQSEPNDQSKSKDEKETKEAKAKTRTAAEIAAKMEGLNLKHCVISNLAGKVMVMEWVRSSVDRNLLIPSYQSVAAFRERYMNQYVSVEDEKGQIKLKQLGHYWLSHDRRQYEGIDLVPNGPESLPGNMLNLWKGWGVVAKPGKWDLMQSHIYEVLANRDEAVGNYIVDWSAWGVQNPDDPAEVALCIRGPRGIGKGTFFHALRRIYGNHGLHISSSKHLVGDFNAHMQSCIYLFADEAFWAGDRPGENKLKALITEPVTMIERKGFDAFQWKNRVHLAMAANADWMVPAGHDERRYVISDTSTDHRNEAYYTALRKELNEGGLEAMLWDLQHRDLRDWHPRRIVQTEALRLQKEQSMSHAEQWYEDLLQTGELPGFVADRPDRATNAALFSSFKKDNPNRWETKADMVKFLKDMKCKHWRSAGERGWEFPPLVEARASWEKRFRSKWPWDEDVPEWFRLAKSPLGSVLRQVG